MARLLLFSIGLILFHFPEAPAQGRLRTDMGKELLVAGEPFQVQYILEGVEDDYQFITPVFKNFQVVSGPFVYEGVELIRGKPGKIRNIVFTLVAKKRGRIMIPGAAVRWANRYLRSESVWVDVISPTESLGRAGKEKPEPNGDYVLMPGEDPDEKVRRNLFMDIQVDRRSCYVGQPVTATFRLYSSLESKSDIIKNPGFYGFTIHDMINLGSPVNSVEKINGKYFDVHTVRKVQLYPWQPGEFVIEPMEVKNRVEFSKSAVFRKTEQEITEGIYSEEESEPGPDKLVIENTMATQPVGILVKQHPEIKKPAGFGGATGDFRISVIAEKEEWSTHEEGFIDIVIYGKGNFSQLLAPSVTMPPGLMAGTPAVIDSLDYRHSPMSGKRVFRIPIMSESPGNYLIAPISFPYFDPVREQYRTSVSDSLRVVISNSKELAIKQPVGSVQKNTRQYYDWYWMGIVALLGLFMILVRKKKKEPEALPAVASLPVTNQEKVAEALRPAMVFMKADPETFYPILRTTIWNFLASTFHLSGSEVNKTRLYEAMEQRKTNSSDRERIMEILDYCEMASFADMEPERSGAELLREVTEILEKLSASSVP